MNATQEAKRTRQFWVSLRRERVTHVFSTFYFLYMVIQWIRNHCTSHSGPVKLIKSALSYQQKH